MLQGEARSVIEGFKISSENYESAWKLLKDTYDNNIVIIQNHLDELLNFPEITKNNKADSIRKFIWHIQTHVSALKTLALPVDDWDAILLHLAKKKLDFIEQRDWQNLIKNRTPQNMPKLSEFMTFLTERCHTMKILEQSQTKTEKLLNRDAKKSERKVALVSVINKCKICEGDHLVFRCGDLLKLPIAKRKQKLIDKKLCLNCLNAGHYARECKGSTCKKCDKKHNSIIHKEDQEERAQVKSSSEDTPKSVVTTCTESKYNTSAKSSQVIEQQSSTNINNVTANVYCTNQQDARVILSTRGFV